ncbi:MAG TPA: hypothetical protein VKU41_07910 [Polyangiaceae bacterium]|nr:hypothetical protein [Polyangiaceae bacterium]
MKRDARILVVAATSWAAGCPEPGQSAYVTSSEPIQVHGAQFVPGPLPGAPPAPPEEAGAEGGVDAAASSAEPGLSITNVTFASQLVLPGQSGKSVSGRATKDAVAVGIRFADMGSGYWVVPVGGLEPQFPGEITFGFSADFEADDPPGNHSLELVALSAAGAAGQQTDVQLCVGSRVPDKYHACDPTTAPPAAVISLRWDTNFDVDLHVITPQGIDINPKTQIVDALVDGGARPPPNAPAIDRDSLLRCVPDGIRQEDLVFQDIPPSGKYEIYADPYDSCGQSAVRFDLTVYQSSGICPDCRLVPLFTRGGELLAVQANGGTSAGTFVVEYPFASN